MKPVYTRRDFGTVSAAGVLAPRLENRDQSQATPGSTQLLLSYRILPGQWETDTQFEKLIGFLTANRTAVDEISLFDETFPRPAGTSLELLAPVAGVLKQRMAQLRRAGFRSVGINVTYTLGHQDVPGDFLPKLQFPPAVGYDGKESLSCPCPNGTEYREYLKQRYALMARARPDFIWVDDDFRASHHGVLYSCFCPVCLKKFGQESDRAALIARLNAPANTAARQAWTEFVAASLESIAGEIREAVRSANPDVELGLMTIGYSHSTYGGYAIERWMTALGARRGRPGHGYYTDAAPRTIINKVLDAGRRVRDYPATAKTVLYELENWPFLALDKSAQTVLNESALALIMGCTGIAYDALAESPGPLDDYQRLLHAIASERPAWDSLVKSCAGLPIAGFWPADTRMLMTNRKVDEKGWFQEGRPYDILRANQTADIGVPLTPHRSSACGVLLSGRIAEAFSDAELVDMFRSAVFLDADTLRVLWNRGLGDLTGVKPGESFGSSVIEQLTDHPLNGWAAGTSREASVGPGDGVCSLLPAADGVASAARLARYDGKDCGSCLSLFTNRLKGRVAVSSYAPWTALGRGGKRRQVLSVLDWLSAGRLPVIVEQTVRAAPFIRISPDAWRFTMVLLNLALDPTGPLTLRVRAQSRRVTLVSPRSEVNLPVRVSGGDIIIEAASIPAWHTAIFTGTA